MPTHIQVSPEEEVPASSPSAAPPPPPAGSSLAAGRTLIPDDDAPPAPAAAPPPLPAAAAPPPVPAAAPPAPPPRAQPPGGAVPGGPPSSAANPVLCAVLSLFFPGVGQMLAGQVAKGVVILAIAFFTAYGACLLPFLAAFDAYQIAQRRQRGETVGEWQFF